MSVWTDCLDVIYEDPEFSVELRLQSPAAGVDIAVRALPDLADKGDQYGQQRRVIERNVYRVRAYELAAKAPGYDPGRGDKGLVGGRELSIVNAPQHIDDRRLELRLDLSV
jgi:hypothetical protein